MPTVRRHKRSRTVRHTYDYDRMTRNLVIFIVWLAMLLVPISYYGSKYFHGLSSSDAIDIAQIAKQEALGRGFVSGYAKPAMVELTNKIIYPTDIVRAPLYVWILSFFPGVREGNDGSVSLCSSIFFVLTGVLIFQFSLAYSEFTKAIIISVIYLLNIPLLSAAISGLPYMLTAFLFMLVCLLVYLDNGKSFLLTFLIGVVTGACYLSDYHFLPIVVPIALCLLYRHVQDRWRFLALFLIGFVAITSPWILRNYKMGLNPFIGFPLKYRMIMDPDLKENLTFGRFGLGKFEELYSYGAVVRNFLSNLAVVYARFMRFGSMLIIFSFIGSMFLSFNGLGLVRAIVYSSVALVIAGVCLDNGNIADLTPLFPMIIFLGVAGLYKIVDSADTVSNNSKLWVVRIFVVLNIAPFLWAFMYAGKTSPARWHIERSRLIVEELGSIVGAQEFMLTDEPWKIAWYSNVPAILLPQEAEDYKLLTDAVGDFRFVYMTKGINQKRMKLWSTIYQSRSVPLWFPLREGHVLSDKSLILSDRKRW